jgi:hypothetical protein
MGIFSRLFGNNNQDHTSGGHIAITEGEFLATAYIQHIIAAFRKDTTLLGPQRSSAPVPPSHSKFGGIPNGCGFDIYPCCDSCNTPLNFVLQLYKKDFPEHYYPDEKDLFQLFRCPNGECPEAYSENSDQKMFPYYFTVRDLAYEGLVIPEPDPVMDSKVPDCFLNPVRQADYPIWQEYGNTGVEIESRFGEKLGEYFFDTFAPVQRTKTGGYPSFAQNVYYPDCACGCKKEFFFQLSSDDHEGQEIPAPDNWSPHQIMIGDVGNIYFYVCRDCGESSIESYWDCY